LGAVAAVFAGIADQVTANGCRAVDCAVRVVLAGFAYEITAAGRFTADRYVGATEAAAGATGVAAREGVLAITVAAAESVLGLALLCTVTVGRADYAILAVSGLTDAVAADGAGRAEARAVYVAGFAGLAQFTRAISAAVGFRYI
jgi:hypothetical protein